MTVKDTTVIAGQGWVYYSSVDAKPFDLKAFTGVNPTEGITGWTWLGSTSKDNLASLEKSGGDVNILDTWDTPAMRSQKAKNDWTLTVNALSVTPEMLGLAFPGGKFDKTSKTFKVPAAEETIEKALLVVIKDEVQGMVGIYFPRGTLTLAGAPSLSSDNFMEVPLQMSALTSIQTGNRIEFILPEALAAGAGTI